MMRHWIHVGLILLPHVNLSQGGVAPPSDSTGVPASRPLIGVAVRADSFAAAVDLLEAGRADEAVASAREALRRKSGRPMGEINELRLGLGVVLLRGGDPSAARKMLLPLSRAKDPADLADRAAVLHEIGSRWLKKRDRPWPLQTRDGWRQAVRQLFDDQAAELRARHGETLASLRRELWSEAPAHIASFHDRLRRLRVMELGESPDSRLAVAADHARLLVAETAEVQRAIDRLIHRADELALQMSAKTDRSTGRRGYLPAAVVEQYNALVDRMTEALEAGGLLAAEYDQTVDAHAGHIPRDRSVRMNPTRLRSKRPIFGR